MRTLFYIKEIWRGKDLYRILMNKECARQTINGKILDIGSGKKLASYHRFLQCGPNSNVELLDLVFARETGKRIDFEKDVLPFADASVDTVLLFNVLEHIYNFGHLLGEVKRVLKPGGKVIGSVPFLVGYHTDPHDYWRFTTEALEKIFLQHGFSSIKIKIIGKGPVTAAFSQIEFILPRCLKFIFLPLVFLFDNLVLKLSKTLNREKFALGLFLSLQSEYYLDE